MNWPPKGNAPASADAWGAELTGLTLPRDCTATLRKTDVRVKRHRLPAGAPSAAKQLFELRIRKETTGAVVLFQTYTSFAEAQKVAERLVGIGCPVPIIVEVPV